MRRDVLFRSSWWTLMAAWVGGFGLLVVTGGSAAARLLCGFLATAAGLHMLFFRDDHLELHRGLGFRRAYPATVLLLPAGFALAWGVVIAISGVRLLLLPGGR